MKYKVYWTNPTTNKAASKDFEHLSDALAECEQLRRSNKEFVTLVSENPDHVGKVGVAGVVDGKLPDGSDYSWTKEDCVGAAFKTQPLVSTDNLVVDLDDPTQP